jgi:elongation factor P
MAIYNMNQVRVGIKILMDGDPCLVVDTDVVKPGKGQAFTRVRHKNYRTGRVIETTLKASDTVEGADIHESVMQFLFTDGDMWTFMDQESFEQVAATAEVVGDAKLWIKEEDLCTVTLFEGNPIVVTPPTFVYLEVTETDPGLKGDTSSGGNKPATMETGAVVRVPLFIQIGEKIKVDTRTGEYVSRA